MTGYDVPMVVVSPAHRFGRPSVKGVATEFIADSHWLDDDPEDNYGLTRHELLVALWFEASQGQPRFRRRWREWLNRVDSALWNASTLDPQLVELPPTASRPAPACAL